jgi:hypothetical protein
MGRSLSCEPVEGNGAVHSEFERILRHSVASAITAGLDDPRGLRTLGSSNSTPLRLQRPSVDERGWQRQSVRCLPPPLPWSPGWFELASIVFSSQRTAPSPRRSLILAASRNQSHSECHPSKILHEPRRRQGNVHSIAAYEEVQQSRAAHAPLVLAMDQFAVGGAKGSRLSGGHGGHSGAGERVAQMAPGSKGDRHRLQWVTTAGPPAAILISQAGLRST